MSCENHKKDLFGETDMKKVAEAVGDLHYETLAELFKHLVKKFKDDAFVDRLGDRNKIATHLWNASNHTANLEWAIRNAWQISKPFMKEEKDV